MLNRFMSLSLRTHLLVMAILLAVPAFVLILYSSWHQSRDLIKAGVTETQKIVRSISSEQYNFTGDAEQLLMVLAQLPEVKNHNVISTNAILTDILSKSPQFGNMVIADRNGDVWASGLPMTISFSIKERRTFTNTVKHRQFSSGEYNIGKISARPTIGFGYPIIDKKGDIDGVIAVNINFRHFNKIIEHAGLPTNSIFTICDHNGTIINRNINTEQYVGKKDNDKIFQRMLEGPDEASSINAEDDCIESYHKLQLTGEQAPYLYMRASIPLHAVQQEAIKNLIGNIAFLLPFLIAVFVIVIAIGNYCFLQQIKKLQETVQGLAEGDLHLRVADVVKGKEFGLLGSAFDEMARKLASREQALLAKQKEMNSLNLNLSAKVEEETTKRVQQERLMARQDRLAAIGEMIGAIAHQWRQPLTTIGATIQSIRMAWDRQTLTAEFMEHAEADAQKQLYHMSQTIEDFRNFFNPEKTVTQFNVKEKVREVSLLVAAQFANSDIRLEITDLCPDTYLLIEGYQNEFKQALLNLVSNSFDAIKERGASDNYTAGTVEISERGENGTVIIEVKDNGCGIPLEHADKVFEPYFTSKSDGKGTGIGLYMSRLIIKESMGGSLSFTSCPSGTVFKIILAGVLAKAGSENG